MPRLLVVHHTVSPALQAMLEAVLAGARDEEIEGVEVQVRRDLADCRELGAVISAELMAPAGPGSGNR